MARNATDAPAILPNRIHHVMRSQGRRMEWLARKTGFSVYHVSRVANGRLPASRLFRQLAAEAVDMPEDYLFPGSEGQP